LVSSGDNFGKTREHILAHWLDVADVFPGHTTALAWYYVFNTCPLVALLAAGNILTMLEVC